MPKPKDDGQTYYEIPKTTKPKKRCIDAKYFWQKWFANHCWHDDNNEYPRLHGDGTTTLHMRHFWVICCWCKKEEYIDPCY